MLMYWRPIGTSHCRRRRLVPLVHFFASADVIATAVSAVTAVTVITRTTLSDLSATSINFFSASVSLYVVAYLFYRKMLFNQTCHSCGNVSN